MDPLFELFDRNPVFASLGDADRNFLLERAVDRELRKGETLAMQGDVWPYLFVVARGELDAVKVSSEGRSLLVTTIKAGEIFWGPAFFQEGVPMLAALEARSTANVYLWTRQSLEPFLIEHGRMTWEICCLMIQRMQRASAILEELAFQPVAGRLAHLLLENFKSAGDAAISRHLTLDEMAARIGTTREMVCRILYRFMDRKFIEITRTEFVLTDQDGLTHMADGQQSPSPK